MLLSLFIHAASGYESDQLTARLHELDDARQLANATANEMLARAIARTNVMAADADGTCRSDTATLSHELARNIREVMGKTTLIPSRGEQGIMYYGTYAAWLETGPIDRYTFTERNDIYSQVSFAENPIIATWAPASTIRLGDVLLGVDKIDHFWVQGHLYYEKAHQGERDEQAVRYGTRTERMKWGMMTTGVFSYADLAANYDGYRFYRDLLQPGSILQRDEDGCVVQVEALTGEASSTGAMTRSTTRRSTARAFSARSSSSSPSTARRSALASPSRATGPPPRTSASPRSMSTGPRRRGSIRSSWRVAALTGCSEHSAPLLLLSKRQPQPGDHIGVALLGQLDRGHSIGSQDHHRQQLRVAVHGDRPGERRPQVGAPAALSMAAGTVRGEQHRAAVRITLQGERALALGRVIETGLRRGGSGVGGCVGLAGEDDEQHGDSPIANLTRISLFMAFRGRVFTVV